MFSKASKPAPGAVASGGSGSKRVGGIPSIISPDLKVEGNLTCSGDIQVDGFVEGDVTSRGLTVGDGATVRGAVVAETIRVYGSVSGTITANSVILASTAKVDGDITHGSLSMEAGASLAGQIKRLERPVGGGSTTSSTGNDAPASSSYSGTTPSKPYGA
ncbi:MAG: bactofilin family protein [Alphaproteobacteria bacterium]